MDFDSASAAERALVPREIQFIRTAGYRAAGDGGGGAYQKLEAEPTHPGGWFRSADGACWRYSPDARGINAKAFGAAGDGVIDPQSLQITHGSGDAAAIQNAIDFAIYQGGRSVYLPAGIYRLDDALHLGYGENRYESLTLEGDGPNYRGQMSGTALVADFSDRPALAVQGARMTHIRDLGVIGRNAGWILGQELMGPAPKLDDTAIGGWIDPGLHPSAASRYAPYAGVAIDPYSGPPPDRPYAPVRYPAFLGAVAQYGKAFSSEVLVENCYVGGFVVGLAIHPSDASGNGDFVRMRNSRVELCAYVISAGDSQGREVSAVQCGMSLFHTGVVNAVHGRRQGQLDFSSESTSWESCIQIIDIGAAAYAGPFRFAGGYSENIWRIGDWGRTGAEGDQPLSIENHLFHFTAQQLWTGRGVPATILDAAAPNRVALRSCGFVNFSNVMLFGGDPAGYMIENCTAQVHSRSGGVPEARPLVCDKLAHDALAGGLSFVPAAERASRPTSLDVGTGLFDVDTGAYEGPVAVATVAAAKRGRPVCAWSAQAEPIQNPGAAEPCPPRWTAYDKSQKAVITGASVSASTGRLTALFARLTRAQQALFGPAPGDILHDSDSRTIFRVRSVVGTEPATVVADIWNNHRVQAGAWSMFNPFHPGEGLFLVLNTRLYRPAWYTEGEFAAGETKVARVGRADGFGAYVGGAGEIRVGDWLRQNAFTDATLGQGVYGDEIVGAAPGALVLAKPAAASAAHKPIAFLIRRPPANDT